MFHGLVNTLIRSSRHTAGAWTDRVPLDDVQRVAVVIARAIEPRVLEVDAVDDQCVAVPPAAESPIHQSCTRRDAIAVHADLADGWLYS
jgi:hypothetical protein